jgi:chromosome segregation ATPase
MEPVLVDEARVRAWVEEGQKVLQHVVPFALGERDALRSQLEDATRRCKELQEENDGLRADLLKAAASHRQFEQGHVEIVDSVSQFLTQLTQALDPMRGLAEKLSQARTRRDGA